MESSQSELDLPKPEPDPTWYWQQTRGFGNRSLHWTASGIYLLVALSPILWLSATGDIPAWTKDRRIVFAWGLFVAIAHPVWSWLETRAFERWVRISEFTDSTRKLERAYYAQMRDHSKAFWAAILTMYTFAGIWSLFLNQSGQH